MKKLLAGILFLVLTSFGLVAVATGPASADPYPGTVATSTSVANKAKIKAKKKLTMTVTVTAAGNVPVSGVVSCTISKGKYKASVGAAYNGSPVVLKTGKLRKKGRYSISCAYTPPTTDSVFKPSTGSSSVKVKKKRRK